MSGVSKGAMPMMGSPERPDFRLDARAGRRIFTSAMKAKARFADCRGQNMVEFAMTLPLLALLLFGIIQYGFIFNAYMTLRHGMHVAARSIALPGVTNSPKDIVCGAIQPMLDCSNLGTPTVTSNTVGAISAVQVSGSYGLPLIFRFVVPGANGNTLTITASATYRRN
jgi:Flp pilus assembly protein TadG